jgi:hypothetical protein
MLAKKFIEGFDPKNQAHVQWLKELPTAMKEVDPHKKTNQIMKVMQKNPIVKMKLTSSDLLDLPEIHLMLCYKYTNAIFADSAFIPLSDGNGISIQ